MNWMQVVNACPKNCSFKEHFTLRWVSCTQTSEDHMRDIDSPDTHETERQPVWDAAGDNFRCLSIWSIHDEPYQPIQTNFAYNVLQTVTLFFNRTTIYVFLLRALSPITNANVGKVIVNKLAGDQLHQCARLGKVSEQKVKVGHCPRARISLGTGRLPLKQQTDGPAHAALDTALYAQTRTHTMSEKHQVPTSVEYINHRYTDPI